MIYKYFLVISLLIFTSIVAAQNYYDVEFERQCPQHWVKYERSCYRFIQSPLKPREDAKRTCQAYQSDLVSVNNVAEHGFILNELLRQDPQRRLWYTSVKRVGGYWTNEGDGATFDMESAIFNKSDYMMRHDYLAYGFYDNKWGLMDVSGNESLLYICEALVKDVYARSEDDRDYTYGIAIDDPRRIPRGPYFIKQPKNVIFDSSNSEMREVVLHCLAGGYPTPSYEWFKEEYDNIRLIGTKIDPLSNIRFTISGGNLIIYNPTYDDQGSYHCKATNKFGTIISESSQLLFSYISEFNLKRSGEEGDQNWGKAIFCDPPRHFPKEVKYYWNRGAYLQFVEEDNRVFVSSDGALYISALQPIDRGNYSCMINSRTSSTGRHGPFFQLDVVPHSSFQTLQFANNFPKAFPENPLAGDEVRLECLAFGYPVPSYNWTRIGAPLPRNYRLANFNRVLIIPHVRIEDQGDYVCNAHNDKPSISSAVRLTIRATPNFTIPLEDRHMDIRGNLTWVCEAFGIPDVTYHWFKNGHLLEMQTLATEDRDRYFIHDNILRIQPLLAEYDAAMFQCRAKNDLKSTYSSAQLRVLSLKPSFKKRPMEPSTYAAERGNVTIVCNPEAAPRPTFTWRKEGNIIGDGGRRRILENGNLIITRVSRDDEGVYICSAKNDFGTDQSQGRLVVLRGPYFVQELPPQITTDVMYNETLRCQADSGSMLDIAYNWTHNGIPIRDKDLMDNPRWKKDGGVLDLINITLSDAGVYECILESAVGRVKTQTTLVVRGPPGPPGGIKVLIEKMSVRLWWTDGAFNGRPIIKYAVSAISKWTNQWFNLSENILAQEVDRYTGQKEAFLTDVLNPFTSYEFRVSAANELGFGTPSLPSPIYSTIAARPVKAPKKVGGGGGKLGDLVITWEPLLSQDHYGREVHYKVFWRRKGHEREFQKLLLKESGNIGKYVVNIQRDYYYTEYEVQVQVFNEAGAGPLSEIKTIFSAEDMPQVQPQRVYALSYNSTSLNVSWAPLEEFREIIRGKLIGYRIKYWFENGTENEPVYFLSRTRRPWSLIVGLQPDTYYYVKVMAYNSAGAGPESERYLERTYRKAPQNPPSTVQVYQYNPSTVRVEWRYVQSLVGEEPLDGFKVRVWEIDQDMSTANHTIVPTGKKLEAYVEHLSPGKTYNLRVLAYSKGGDGRMSSPTNTFQMGDPAAFRNDASSKISVIGLTVSLFIITSPFGLI